jgi:hypothetical protein
MKILDVYHWLSRHSDLVFGILVVTGFVGLLSFLAIVQGDAISVDEVKLNNGTVIYRFRPEDELFDLQEDIDCSRR